MNSDNIVTSSDIDTDTPSGKVMEIEVVELEVEIKEKHAFLKKLVSSVFVIYLLYLSLWKCPLNKPFKSQDPCLCTPLHISSGLSIYSYNNYVSPYYHNQLEPTIQPYISTTKKHLDPLISSVSNNVNDFINNNQLDDKYYLFSSKAIHIYSNYHTRLINHPTLIRLINTFQLLNLKFDEFLKKHQIILKFNTSLDTTHEKLQPFIDSSLTILNKFSNLSLDFLKTNILPKLCKNYLLILNNFKKISNNLKLYFNFKILPFLKKFYYTQIHPQFLKIGERITSNSTSLNNKTISSTSSNSINKQKFNSIQWSELINATCNNAISSFIKESESLKNEILQSEKSNFESLLSSYQMKIHKFSLNIGKEILKIKPTIEDIKNPKLTRQDVRDYFTEAYKIIDDNELEIFKKLDFFKNNTLFKINLLKNDTIDILKEFKESTLQEYARQILSSSSKVISTSTKLQNQNSNPNKNKNKNINTDENDNEVELWDEWKNYHLLKTKLISTELNLLNYSISNQDLIIYCRDIKITTQIITRESTQFLQILRAKANLAFQEREVLERKLKLEEEEEENKKEIESKNKNKKEIKNKKEQKIIKEIENENENEIQQEKEIINENITLTSTLTKTITKSKSSTELDHDTIDNVNSIESIHSHSTSISDLTSNSDSELSP